MYENVLTVSANRGPHGVTYCGQSNTSHHTPSSETFSILHKVGPCQCTRGSASCRPLVGTAAQPQLKIARNKRPYGGQTWPDFK